MSSSLSDKGSTSDDIFGLTTSCQRALQASKLRWNPRFAISEEITRQSQSLLSPLSVLSASSSARDQSLLLFGSSALLQRFLHQSAERSNRRAFIPWEILSHLTLWLLVEYSPFSCMSTSSSLSGRVSGASD